MKTIDAAFALEILVFACGASQTSAAQASARSTLEFPRYDLRVRLLPQASRIEVTGDVSLQPAPAPREEIALRLAGSMRDFRVDFAEPLACAGPAALERYGEGGAASEWRVRPERPIPSGEPVLLRFSYAGGETPSSNFCLAPEASFASAWGTAWYPMPAEPAYP